jgi:hypothetical protein
LKFLNLIKLPAPVGSVKRRDAQLQNTLSVVLVAVFPLSPFGTLDGIVFVITLMAFPLL